MAFARFSVWCLTVVVEGQSLASIWERHASRSTLFDYVVKDMVLQLRGHKASVRTVCGTKWYQTERLGAKGPVTACDASIAVVGVGQKGVFWAGEQPCRTWLWPARKVSRITSTRWRIWWRAQVLACIVLGWLGHLLAHGHPAWKAEGGLQPYHLWPWAINRAILVIWQRSRVQWTRLSAWIRALAARPCN